MTERYKNPVTQYLDDAADPFVAGKLYFYETGTATLKNTYADQALTIANSNPVILTAAGRIPNIFLDGVYKVKLTDADAVQIWERDNVGEISDVQLAGWESSTTYAADDLVQGSDGEYYRSLVGTNLNNDPISSPVQWVKILNTYQDSVGDGSDAIPYVGNSKTVSTALDDLATDIAGNASDIADNVTAIALRLLISDQASQAEQEAGTEDEKYIAPATQQFHKSAAKAWVNFNATPDTGTYSRTGTLITVTMTGHGLSTGMIAELEFTTGAGTDGEYSVTVTDVNTFTVVDAASGATSGNVTRHNYIRSAYGVTSITDTAVGAYEINLTSALSSLDRTVLVSCSTVSPALGESNAQARMSDASTAVVAVDDTAGALLDVWDVNAVFYRDLA